MKRALALVLVLSGCALIDQDTFAPSSEPDPAAVATMAPPAVPTDPRKPLLVIDYATPAPDYQQPLRFVVRAAEARNRRIQYDVIAVAPTMNQASVAREQAVAVMRTMMGNAVPAGRIHLGLRAEPWQPSIQVRIYVR